MRGTVRTTAALGALGVLALAGCASGPGEQAEPKTAWEAHEQMSAYLMETAEAVGLDAVEQVTGEAEPFECQRLLKEDGTGTKIELDQVRGEAESDVLSAIAEKWAADGYEVRELGGRVEAGSNDEGLLQALQMGAGGSVDLSGTTGCMDEVGSPEE